LALTIVCSLIILAPIQFAQSQNSNTAVSVAPAENSVRVGETLTVNITISNVQNLYGIDLTLDWNSSVLQIIKNETILGVELRPGGVLHGSHISYDINSYAPGDVIITQDTASQQTGEFHLVATSSSPSPSFNGSGIVAVLTFNVTSVGHSTLNLEGQLADHPLSGDNSQEIIAQFNDGSINAVIPEFPQAALLIVLVALVTIAVLFSKKLHKKKGS